MSAMSENGVRSNWLAPCIRSATRAQAACSLRSFPDTDYGFAAALMGSVNLPSLGQGDSAWLALTYTDGAIGYILGGSNLAAVIGAGPLGLPSRTPTSTR